MKLGGACPDAAALPALPAALSSRQRQRWSCGTWPRICSTCAPQPRQPAFPHVEHVTGAHMSMTSTRSEPAARTKGSPAQFGPPRAVDTMLAAGQPARTLASHGSRISPRPLREARSDVPRGADQPHLRARDHHRQGDRGDHGRGGARPLLRRRGPQASRARAHEGGGTPRGPGDGSCVGARGMRGGGSAGPRPEGLLRGFGGRAPIVEAAARPACAPMRRPGDRPRGRPAAFRGSSRRGRSD